MKLTKQDKEILESWGLCEEDLVMKLTKEDKEMLKSFGFFEEDLDQIELATSSRYTKYELDNKNISRDEVISLLGREVYLSGIARSAFHWSALRTTEDGKEIYFDSSNLFN